VTLADLLPWISLAVSVGTPVAIFAGRNWLKARIERGVQFSFDNKLENLRAQLRRNEEAFKTDLRNKESEIALLRSSVLSGSVGRQSLLDKRRFEAVEKVWTAINDFAQLKGLSAMMSVVNFEALAKRTRDPNIQMFLDVMGAGAPDVKNAKDISQLKNVARDERPFLPELAWAYFSAYTTILFGNLLRYMVLKTGLPGVAEVLTNEPAKKILKAALPHQSTFIDKHEPGAYHHLLDELEMLLLAELRKILEGEEADRAAIEKAKGIMDAVGKADEEAKKDAARAAGIT
jgi:hypothetical protein